MVKKMKSEEEAMEEGERRVQLMLMMILVPRRMIVARAVETNQVNLTMVMM